MTDADSYSRPERFTERDMDKRFILRSDAFDPNKLKQCTRCGIEKLCTPENFRPKSERRSQAVAHCRQCDRLRSKEYRAQNTERCKEASRISAGRWYRNNKELRKRQVREQWKDPEFRKKQAEYFRRKRRTCPASKVRVTIGNQLRDVLRGTKAGRKTFDFLGYSRDELLAHIERQFLPGMSWEKLRIGAIHIDHIVPLSSFDFSAEHAEESARRAWALPNLRPLWAKDNLRKGAKRTYLL